MTGNRLCDMVDGESSWVRRSQHEASMSDIEEQLRELKEKLTRYDQENPNLSLAQLDKRLSEDPLGVWEMVSGPVGDLLSLEDPFAFRELRRKAEGAHLQTTLHTRMLRMPIQEKLRFTSECLQRALSLLKELLSQGAFPPEKFQKASEDIKHHLNELSQAGGWVRRVFEVLGLASNDSLLSLVRYSAQILDPEEGELYVRELRWRATWQPGSIQPNGPQNHLP